MRSLFAGVRNSRRGWQRQRQARHDRMLATFEPLESRALLTAMTFTIEDNSGLDPTEYALYAMGSNFTSSAGTNWYMDGSFTLVNGAPPNNQTPSYKVAEE